MACYLSTLTKCSTWLSNAPHGTTPAEPSRTAHAATARCLWPAPGAPLASHQKLPPGARCRRRGALLSPFLPPPAPRHFSSQTGTPRSCCPRLAAVAQRPSSQRRPRQLLFQGVQLVVVQVLVVVLVGKQLLLRKVCSVVVWWAGEWVQVWVSASVGHLCRQTAPERVWMQVWVCGRARVQIRVGGCGYQAWIILRRQKTL